MGQHWAYPGWLSKVSHIEPWCLLELLALSVNHPVSMVTLCPCPLTRGATYLLIVWEPLIQEEMAFRNAAFIARHACVFRLPLMSPGDVPSRCIYLCYIWGPVCVWRGGCSDTASPMSEAALCMLLSSVAVRASQVSRSSYNQ